jgi:hypothetical protein
MLPSERLGTRTALGERPPARILLASGPFQGPSLLLPLSMCQLAESSSHAAWLAYL